MDLKNKKVKLLQNASIDEDYVLEHSPIVKEMIKKSEADRKAGRTLSLSRYLANLDKLA